MNRLVLGAGLVVVLAAPAAAQTRVDDLAPGDTLRVRYEVPTLLSRGGSLRSSSALRRIEGQLLVLRPDTLVVAAPDRSTAIALARVRELAVRRGEARGGFGRGALWGGLIGAVAVGGFAVGIASTTSDNPGYGSDSNWIAAGAGAGLVLGALIGGIVNRFLDYPAWEDVTLP